MVPCRMTTSIMCRNMCRKIMRRVVLPLLFWLGVWWLFAAVVGRELLIPAPWRVAAELAALAPTVAFWQTVATTLLRIFGGLLAGVVLGVVLAVGCCRYALLDDLLAPAIRLVRATPVASFIVLLLLWVKSGAVPGVVAALMVLPIIWEAVCSGIRALDKDLLEMAQVYRMSRKNVVRYIFVPQLRPHFVAGLCTAIGLAWKSGVAAEVLCLPKMAIGAEVYYAKIYLETPSLFAWSITVIVLSLLLEGLARRLLGVRK